jgi:Arc/MetJ-type ribon-helix-helix transcriptional regulator
MKRSGKISVAVPREHLIQIRRAVEAGEFGSTAAVVRDAVRVWLHRRNLHAGRHGAAHFSRSLEARREKAHTEPMERVELMFDAGDAKA